MIKNISTNCEPEEMNAEDPLFILYTQVLLENQKEFYIPQVVTWFMHQ